METDVYQVCSEAKSEVRFGENSTGSSLYMCVVIRLLMWNVMMTPY